MKAILISFLCLFSALQSNAFALDEELNARYTRRTKNGVHVPLFQSKPRAIVKRAENGTEKLGDYFDVIYTVLLELGTVATPLTISTGTSDLWVFSDACKACNASGIPFYPQATFEPADLDVSIAFASNRSVSGIIGRDTVSLAGFSLPNQYFGSINATTLGVGFASVGGFGLGFATTSEIWYQLLNREIHNSKPGEINSIPDAIFDSYQRLAPLVLRMVINKYLKYPMFTLTLQRTTVDLTGRMPGLLSLGELPEGVRNESLHWVPLRPYSVSDGGLPPPPSAPTEQYPYNWEVYIDDVFFDGERLAPSKLSPPSMKISALIDIGTAGVNGPADVISEIVSRMGGTSFPCGEPHSLVFQIGGEMFPVDPRDLIYSPDHKSADSCKAHLSIQDAPDLTFRGPRYSWVLGDSFLRGVIASFYYGNLARPSIDPPRIGLVSRVPGNAADLLKIAVDKGLLPYSTDELTGFALSSNESATPSTSSSSPSPTNDVEKKQGGAQGSMISRPLLYLMSTFVFSFAGL